MITDHSQLADEERTMLDIDAERTEALRLELHQLGFDEQRTYDMELRRLHEDVLHHDNASTDQIIANFERHRSSSEDNDDYGTSPANVFNRAWHDESLYKPPDSSAEDALNHNFVRIEQAYNLDADTESEDDTVNVAELLQANMKLLTFLTQQSETIARLCVRIVRLKTLIYDLSFRPVGPLPDNAHPPNPTQGTSPPLPDNASPPLPPVTTYYGIQRGRLIGVCDSWEELQRRIAGSSHSVFQSFSTWQAAKAYVIEGMWNDMPDEARCYATPPSLSASQSCVTEGTLPDTSHDTAPANDTATVLVDTDNPNYPGMDASFLVKPHDASAVDMSCLDHTKIQNQLATPLAKIHAKGNKQDELWMYFDSGASRSVISTTSPVQQHLQAIGPAYGSCSIGDGRPLHYLEKGHITDNLEVTVVNDLKYDLFFSVNAAKQGLTSIIDYDLHTGQNKSNTIDDKLTGHVTPLVERGKDILELPLHLMLPSKACVSIPINKNATQDALPPHVVSMF
jgi:hypothetical protein